MPTPGTITFSTFTRYLIKKINTFLGIKRPIGHITTFYSRANYRKYLHGEITFEEWQKSRTGYSKEPIYADDLKGEDNVTNDDWGDVSKRFVVVGRRTETDQEYKERMEKFQGGGI